MRAHCLPELVTIAGRLSLTLVPKHDIRLERWPTSYSNPVDRGNEYQSLHAAHAQVA
jgi:hypothetical protein